MNNTEIKAQIDADITNKVVDDSITPNNVGVNMKDVVDLAKDFKELRVKLSIASNVVTDTEVLNEFTGTSFSYNYAGLNAVLRITASPSNPLTSDKCFVETQMIFDGTTAYSVIPNYTFLPLYLDLNIVRQTDGDQTSLPDVSNQLIIIKQFD